MVSFGKKSKTETKTEVTEATLTKIVKLSYIQSLAIDGGVTDPKSLVGESTGDSVTIDSKDPNKYDKATKISNKLGSIGTALLPGGLGATLKVVSALFGKKVETSSNTTIEDSGWTLVKTWAQPQFDVIRYALGIKELTVSQFTYQTVSEIISKSWSSPKEITKVTLTVDQFIPPQFPPGVYIEYYIKPDIKDVDWIRINALSLPTQYTSEGTIIPRIITFNTERPVSSNLEQAYVNTSEPVRSIRFKAILKRPEDLTTYTPILRSYRMIFSLRNGL